MNRTIIKDALTKLGTPKAIETNSFEALLDKNISLAKEVLGENWYPLESDPYMKKLRVLTLRQIHNQADKNLTILSLLATTALGNDLDSIGIDRGVIRDEGQAPFAEFKFNLTKVSDGTLLIPSGTKIGLEDEVGIYATTIRDAVVLKGSSSVVTVAELSYPCVSSEIVLDTLITDIPYVAMLEQISSFSSGSIAEDDDRYRVRIILNRNRFNTAGSIDAYTFYTYSADSRIDDVFITSEAPLEVNVYIASFDGVDDEMIKRVEETLNAKEIRPLGDRVIVKPAKVISITLVATIEIFNIENSSLIEEQIRANFEESFFIGQDFVRSDFDRKCHVDGVYRVVSNFKDVIVGKKEIVKINSLKLDFKEFVR
jgi:phage-related baseplate assembly protein